MNATVGQRQPPSRPAASTAKRWRSVLRAGALVAAGALLSPWLAATEWPQLVPAASAWVALCTTVALRRVESVFLVAGLLAATLALPWRRWFCRWGCPVGLCADAASRIGRGLGCRSRSMPPLGQWLAIATLGGSVVGYPLLLPADPLAMLAAFFGLLAWPVSTGAIYAALALPLVCLLSVLVPGLWCGRICPLGATQDILWQLGRLLRRLPAAAIAVAGRGSAGGQSTVPPGLIPAESIATAHSPAATLPSTLTDGGQADAGQTTGAADGWPLARRTAIGTLIGLFCASLVRQAARAESVRIRPPSARPEADFLGLCIRCGNCARACPTKIITPDSSPPSLAALLAPVVSFSAGYCREDCRACTEVCPTGAIATLPGGDKLAAPLGIARVDMSLCLLGDDRECFVCRNCCPFQAIRLVFCEETYQLTPQIDRQRCPGCGACQLACPVTPKKAIVVYPLG